MRHAKRTFKIGRNSSHRRALIANMLKSLILNERVETTLTKAKELKRQADRMITLSKKGNLAAIRRAKAKLMLRYNSLTPKEQKKAKEGDLSAYNDDRKVLLKLDELQKKYQDRSGGYTRIMRTRIRVGDASQQVLIEYI